MDDTQITALYGHLVYATAIVFACNLLVGWLNIGMDLLLVLPVMAYIRHQLSGIFTFDNPHGDHEMITVFMATVVPIFTGSAYAILLVPYRDSARAYMSFGVSSLIVLLLDLLQLVTMRIIDDLAKHNEEKAAAKATEKAAKKDN
jgi:hypothetical protein